MKMTRRGGLSAAVIALAGIVAASPAAAQEKIKLTFSTYWPTSYEYLYKPIEAFAEKVEKRTDGRVEIEIFHSAQLFGGKEEFGAVERGDVDMSAPLDIYHTGKVPALGVSSLPFMWASPAALQETLDAGLWDQGINQALAEHNMKVLNVAVGGPYQIYAKDFPVRQPADLSGKKIAVSGTTASKAMQLLDASPTTMSSGELYLALQRGTIDGTTRPLLTGLGRKLYEVLDHLTITNMAYFTTFLVINQDKWESLPADVQQVIQKAADERSADQLDRLQTFLDEAVTQFEDKGVDVHQPSAEQLRAFKDEMAPVYDWWTGEVDGAEKLIEFARENQ
ncbi:TRAP transporter substrate-binding protein [Rhodovibrio sodomensis]|nr:TRAP transporter substrate-binding protein [Rhodovibrio sodomensis]